MPNKKSKRPRPSKKLRIKFAENRIRRAFIQAKIEDLEEKVANALLPGSRAGEKRVLAWARELRRLRELLIRLPIARQGKNGRRKGKKAGTFAGSVTSGQGAFGF